MKDRRFYLFIGMGFELVGLILVSVYLGQVIDEKYALGGLAIALSAMGGLGGWVLHLMWVMKRFE